MATLDNQLDLSRCPHCSVDTPSLMKVWETVTRNYQSRDERYWRIYNCSRCGGLVTASASRYGVLVREVYPSSPVVDESIPDKAKKYLEQAVNSLHTPAGAVMLAASCVDSMLKDKGYKEGSLYSRIDKASEDHLITSDMASWAHQVRLEANDQRHSDEDAELPTDEQARRCVNFTKALAEILYVLPARVTRGIKETQDKSQTT